jgi:hypothetical protein
MQLELLLKYFQLKSTDEIAPLVYGGLVNPLLSLRTKVGFEMHASFVRRLFLL